MKFEAPRGTHDILPSEQPRWRHVLREFERLCELYGYRRIDTPVFEDTELFARTSGHGSDVVTKEMYTFEDRGERSLTLRAEAPPREFGQDCWIGLASTQGFQHGSR